MNRIFAVFMVGAFCIAACGCLQESGARDRMLDEKEGRIPGYSQALLAVKTFMNNASYQPPALAATKEGEYLRLRSENRSFLVTLSSNRVIEAEFEGEDAMRELCGTLAYARAREGNRIFLQDQGFDYPFTRFISSGGYYERGTPGLLFRVNATTGNVATAEFLGPEAMEVVGQMTTYHQITSETAQITMQDSS